MKPVITKSQIRSDLENQVEEFLREGGVVKNIPRGESGHDSNTNPFSSHNPNPSPQQTRTPVDQIVKTLEERKKTGPQTSKLKRPKKKLITDDFGEPLRWVWVDE